MIERAVLDASDAASYLATLRYAGSPSTAVAGVPVSRAIPAAALVPGRRVPSRSSAPRTPSTRWWSASTEGRDGPRPGDGAEGRGATADGDRPYEQPLVAPQETHFRQVPLRTIIIWPHSGHGSPS